MKIYKFRTLLVLMTAACMLAGCRSDIDLGNLDGSMEANLGLSMPVGNVQIGITGVLGLDLDSTATLSIGTIGNQSVLTWKDIRESKPRQFSIFKLDSFLLDAPFSLRFFDQLADAKYYDPLLGDSVNLVQWAGVFGINQIILPEYASDFNSTFEQEMALKLDRINRPGDAQRVDSAQLAGAKFTVSMKPEHFEGIKEEWIDTVDLDLGTCFDLHGKSRYIRIFPSDDPEVGTKNFKFGEDIPLPLDTFTMNMMKDLNEDPSDMNVYDALNLTVTVKYHIPSGTTVKLDSLAHISGSFGVKKLDATALWGWFTPYKDMFDADSIDISSSLSDMPVFSDPMTMLTFSRPIIDAYVQTQVAGAIQMHGEYLSAGDARGKEHYAIFQEGAAEPDCWKFDKSFPKDECVDPTDINTLDSLTHLHITFNREYGHIEKLFEAGIPHTLKYKFSFDFNPDSTPQIRIPMKSTTVNMQSKITMPMVFQKGFALKYNSKLENLDISKFSLDSLLGSTLTLKDSTQLGIIMRSESTLPLHIKLVFRCLDAAGDTIMYNNKPFGLFDTDTLDVYAPDVTQQIDTTNRYNDNWTFEPVVNANWAHLTKAQLDLFPQIKDILYTIIIDDKSLEDFYSDDNDPGHLRDVPISKEQYLKLNIGLSAQIQAAVNLVNNEKK